MRYYFFEDLGYTDDKIINMIKDYYEHIPDYTIAICRYRLTGPETIALVQRTNKDYGSFISLGYSSVFAQGMKVNGVWTVQNAALNYVDGNTPSTHVQLTVDAYGTLTVVCDHGTFKYNHI